MTPKEFILKYKDAAYQIEKDYGVPAIAILAQGALESGWGKKAIGYNIFGIKFKKGDYDFQKVLTTEYSKSPDKFKGCEITSIVYIKESGLYRYKIYQYFADYKNAYDAFESHAKLLTLRYKDAFRWQHSPKRFLIAVWRLGYATAPNYGKTACAVVDSVKRRL